MNYNNSLNTNSPLKLKKNQSENNINSQNNRPPSTFGRGQTARFDIPTNRPSPPIRSISKMNISQQNSPPLFLKEKNKTVLDRIPVMDSSLNYPSLSRPVRYVKTKSSPKKFNIDDDKLFKNYDSRNYNINNNDNDSNEEDSNPNNWTWALDESTNQYYYINTISRTSQWEKPKCLLTIEYNNLINNSNNKSNSEDDLSNWTWALDESTNQYYYINLTTKTSQWEKPDCIKIAEQMYKNNLKKNDIYYNVYYDMNIFIALFISIIFYYIFDLRSSILRLLYIILSLIFS